MLSFGVNEDWSFEADFLKRRADLNILCYDLSFSKKLLRERMFAALNEITSAKFVLAAMLLYRRGVQKRISAFRRYAKIYSDFSSFFNQGNVRFFPYGISNEKGQRFVTLADAFQAVPRENLAENSIFIKMDIELSEFRVIPDLLKFVDYINGMVIEFHELDLLWPVFEEQMDTLKRHFELTHVHGNNYGGLIPNSTTPKVLEVTFLKKSLVREHSRTCKPVSYPLPELDQPNDPSEKDYPLCF
jgi:hypothetical protein